MAARWRNWAGDQICTPASHEHPRSVAEVLAALERAHDAGRVVRVAGAGHSFTDGVLTDGTLLSLARMRRVLDVDRNAGLVRVEAGITLGELSERLWTEGLALENLGDIDVQSIAGATATATHGTGARLQNLSAALHSVELATGDGSVVELSAHSDPEAWRAARVSLGALGVITAVTVRAVPAFTLEGVDRGMPLEHVLERLDELAGGAEHFELFSFPYSEVALTRTNRRVPGPPRPRDARRAWLEDELLKNRAFGLACRAGRARPSLAPAINRVVSRLGAVKSRRVDRSYRIFATPRSVRFTEMEYAIPREHAADALRSVRELVERRRLPVLFPFEVRFVAPDDAFLSPAAGRETCYVAAHMYAGMEWEPFLRGVEEILDGFEGRPHWGKRHFQTAASLRPRYPDWDRFAAVRERLDPDGLFANPHLRRVLGPVPARAAA